MEDSCGVPMARIQVAKSKLVVGVGGGSQGRSSAQEVGRPFVRARRHRA